MILKKKQLLFVAIFLLIAVHYVTAQDENDKTKRDTELPDLESCYTIKDNQGRLLVPSDNLLKNSGKEVTKLVLKEVKTPETVHTWRFDFAARSSDLSKTKFKIVNCDTFEPIAWDPKISFRKLNTISYLFLANSDDKSSSKEWGLNKNEKGYTIFDWKKKTTNVYASSLTEGNENVALIWLGKEPTDWPGERNDAKVWTLEKVVDDSTVPFAGPIRGERFKFHDIQDVRNNLDRDLQTFLRDFYDLKEKLSKTLNQLVSYLIGKYRGYNVVVVNGKHEANDIEPAAIGFIDLTRKGLSITYKVYVFKRGDFYITGESKDNVAYDGRYRFDRRDRNRIIFSEPF